MDNPADRGKRMYDLADLDPQDESSQAEDALFNSPELLGRECQGCFRVLPWNHFQKDASFREGYGNMCHSCRSTPRLSIEENTARLREANLRNHAIKKQRWEHQDQDQLANDAARVGRAMHSSEVLRSLRRLIPDLYVMDGNIVGDLALYRIYGQPQPDLDGRTYRYIGYMHEGLQPEFSQYEFDRGKDIPIRESRRGWRTVLLKLIKAGMTTEDACRKEFGEAVGPASFRWYRELYKFRNATSVA